ncbi:MAG: hypothetical protein WCO26_23830 [Deltaproteobacteria bacterium]
MAFRFDSKKRPEIAYAILQKVNAPGAVENIEKCVSICKVLRRWKGEEHAPQVLHDSVPSQMCTPLFTPS